MREKEKVALDMELMKLEQLRLYIALVAAIVLLIKKCY
jgi:hypothetical protein